jgi:hypothetical protein
MSLANCLSWSLLTYLDSQLCCSLLFYVAKCLKYHVTIDVLIFFVTRNLAKAYGRLSLHLEKAYTSNILVDVDVDN